MFRVCSWRLWHNHHEPVKVPPELNRVFTDGLSQISPGVRYKETAVLVGSCQRAFIIIIDPLNRWMRCRGGAPWFTLTPAWPKWGHACTHYGVGRVPSNSSRSELDEYDASVFTRESGYNTTGFSDMNNSTLIMAIHDLWSFVTSCSKQHFQEFI